jgi:hypothetical protein
MAEEIRDAKMFENWVAMGDVNSLDEFKSFLATEDIANVIPLHELTRTSSDWNSKRCLKMASPFAVPPRKMWQGLANTLRLLNELTLRSLIPKGSAVSVYRNTFTNRCSGGAAMSAHLDGLAIDISPTPGTSAKHAIPFLCNFYFSEGRKWDMGLSFYSNGRIHIDTRSFRTWGDSGHKDTSACKRKK